MLFAHRAGAASGDSPLVFTETRLISNDHLAFYALIARTRQVGG